MADFLDQILAMKGRPVPAIEAPDDWKGEVRIRKVKRNSRNGRPQLHDATGSSRSEGPANPQRPALTASVTECPECGKALDRRNKIGYCKDHRHLSGYRSPRR
jgi:hypothetical protein